LPYPIVEYGACTSVLWSDPRQRLRSARSLVQRVRHLRRPGGASGRPN